MLTCPDQAWLGSASYMGVSRPSSSPQDTAQKRRTAGGCNIVALAFGTDRFHHNVHQAIIASTHGVQSARDPHKRSSHRPLGFPMELTYEKKRKTISSQVSRLRQKRSKYIPLLFWWESLFMHDDVTAKPQGPSRWITQLGYLRPSSQPPSSLLHHSQTLCLCLKFISPLWLQGHDEKAE
jgi:hypothetical protein